MAAFASSAARAAFARARPAQLWAAYTRALSTRPVLTRSATSAVILAAADCTCQKIEGRKEIDVRRAASMGVTGALLVGPSVYKWYSLLGRVFGEASNVRTVAKKLVCDQLVFAPVMFAAIMTSANLLNGKTPEEAKVKLEQELWGAVKRGWCVWSVATSFNFAVIPPQYRVLFNNSVSFGWNCFLSNVNNRASPEEGAKLVQQAMAERAF